MKITLLLAVALLAFASPAVAGLTKDQISKVGVFAPDNAAVPTDLSFRTTDGGRETLAQAADGTPTVVVFADYTCKTLCGPIMAMTSSALVKSGLTPGKDYHLVIIGLDPKDTAEQAKSFVTPQLDKNVAHATTILLGDKTNTKIATNAVGYRYVYDKQHDQFAHPTAAFVLTKDGKLTAALSALGIRSRDIRAALVSAGNGAVGTIADKLRQLCYCYDPATGLYSTSINRLIDAAAVLTLLMLGGLLLYLRKHEPRRANRQ